jgi:hypothetical protein
MEMVSKYDAYSALMEACFNRCKIGRPFDEKCKPFSKEFLETILSYLESNERYEDCQIIKKLINQRFNHELNFKNKYI